MSDPNIVSEMVINLSIICINVTYTVRTVCRSTVPHPPRIRLGGTDAVRNEVERVINFQRKSIRAQTKKRKVL